MKANFVNRKELHFGDLITKALQYKMVPKRPEMSSGCYKSQSFFFQKPQKTPPSLASLDSSWMQNFEKWTNNSTVAEIKGIRLARRLALNAQVSSGPAFSRDPDHDPARLEN